MKDYLISMFIDNELDLDEKIIFVETVHEEQEFKSEAIDLLQQEKLLDAPMVDRFPQMQLQIEKAPRRPFSIPWLRPVALFSTGLALGAAVIFIQPYPDPLPLPSVVTSREIPHRFVIYRPNADRAEIIGTFTQWKPVAMKKTGHAGYWSLTLNLKEGEYQYSYLVEDGQQITDPTIPERVQDDFGGENSIITIKV